MANPRVAHSPSFVRDATQALQPRHSRVFVSIAPAGETSKKEESSNRKQPKSHNGCVTCKAKRMKCDELKPACQRCSRRRIECGGYAKSLKWKPVGKLENIRKAGAGTDLTDERLGVALQPANPLLFEELDSFFADDDNVPVQDPITDSSPTRASSRSESAPCNELPMLSPFTLIQRTTSPPETLKSACPRPGSDYTFGDADAGLFGTSQSDENLLVSGSANQSLDLDDLDIFLSATAMDANFYDHQSLQPADLLLPKHVAVAIPSGNHDWQMHHSEAVTESVEAVREDDVEESTQQTADFDPIVESSIYPIESPLASSRRSTSKDLIRLYQQPRSRSDTQETIRHLFHLQTCEILSIKEDQTKNPWKTVIWPLAYRCPALYYALAAMTCFHLSRSQPALRVQGMRHFQLSMQTLAANEDNGKISLESALTTRLALGFAESWDHQRSSTGIDHINRARELIQQALSEHENSRLVAGELSRLSFLANTWIYMEVIARFTCVDDERSTDFGFLTACSLLSPIPHEQQIDPLMGCAITLFPMIGRLADLVGRVRRRMEKRNSPALISKAADLRIAIEHWIPPIDVGKSEEPSINMSDSIQTAEAYRWAALLMLQQAVPELPWSQSMWELAQKALVFLATVPLTSRTTIVQIFPLMVAGCEAVGAEDRDWVQERWELMSKRMVTGIVDRCRKVTAEVWRRKDEYAATHESCPVFGTSTSQDDFVAAAATRQPSSGGGGACTCSPEADTHDPPSTGFPESVAFRKGIDPLTRAGSIKYTVKGDLHWLRVMKEWGWEVMLG